MVISISFCVLAIAVIILIISINKLIAYVQNEVTDILIENDSIRKEQIKQIEKLAKITYLIETNSNGSIENLKNQIKRIVKE